MVRELIGEVVGLSPYEKRLMDMLKSGGASSEKRMYKFAKNRVSSAYCCLKSANSSYGFDGHIQHVMVISNCWIFAISIMLTFFI